MIAYWDDFCISSPSRILFSAFRLEFPHTMTNYGEPGTEIPTAEALGWALADHRWLRHPFRHLAARMRGSLHTGGSAPEIRSVQRFDRIWIPIWGVEHMEFGPKPSIGISLSLSLPLLLSLSLHFLPTSHLPQSIAQHGPRTTVYNNKYITVYIYIHNKETRNLSQSSSKARFRSSGLRLQWFAKSCQFSRTSCTCEARHSRTAKNVCVCVIFTILALALEGDKQYKVIKWNRHKQILQSFRADLASTPLYDLKHPRCTDSSHILTPFLRFWFVTLGVFKPQTSAQVSDSQCKP